MKSKKCAATGALAATGASFAGWWSNKRKQIHAEAA
jgi:hypothetical protein